MACSRGKAAPNEQTRLRLFADSGGFCQNPGCLRCLFVDGGGADIHIAEMAHIIAASDKGPRARPSLSQDERGAYENLLLLCPSCHVIVDKMEERDDVIRDWKRSHKKRIAVLFGAVEYTERKLAREAIEPILTENKEIFDIYGPIGDRILDPETDMAGLWKRKVLTHILPNNRKMLTILDANRRHLTTIESRILERFRQHVDDLERRHLGGRVREAGIRFPGAMSNILGNNDDSSG